MSRPEPRPALRRSEDGSVHPAAPRVEPEKHLHPVPNAPAAARRPSGHAPAAPAMTHTEFTGKPAKLDVEIPEGSAQATATTGRTVGNLTGRRGHRRSHAARRRSALN